MADEEEEPRCKVTYIDLPEGATEETNWIKRAGKCQVVYPNGGHTFEGKKFDISLCSLCWIRTSTNVFV